MAKLVEIMGITHSPNFPGQIAGPDPEPAILEAARDYELMRKRMAGCRPDLLVVIASDHLNQFFMDNMPAFSDRQGAKSGRTISPRAAHVRYRPVPRRRRCRRSQEPAPVGAENGR